MQTVGVEAAPFDYCFRPCSGYAHCDSHKPSNEMTTRNVIFLSLPSRSNLDPEFGDQTQAPFRVNFSQST